MPHQVFIDTVPKEDPLEILAIIGGYSPMAKKYTGNNRTRRRARSLKNEDPHVVGKEQEERTLKILKNREGDWPAWLSRVEHASAELDLRGKVDLTFTTIDPLTFYLDVKIDPVEVRADRQVPILLAQSWDTDDTIFRRTIQLVEQKRNKLLKTRRKRQRRGLSTSDVAVIRIMAQLAERAAA